MMMGKVLRKSKTMSHIDLDKPVIKPHYYPISKSGIINERNEADRAKIGLLKRKSVANVNVVKVEKSQRKESIEEQSEADIVSSKKTGDTWKNKAVDEQSLRTEKSKESKESKVSSNNKVVVLKDIKKNAGVAAEGSGSYEYDNKFFKYEGQWKNGKKHGTGKLVFVDGSYYEGTFVNGEIDGFGTRFFAASGCKYQGQFEKGELQGKGRMTWPDGSIYEGQWVKNRRQGFGMMKSAKENCLYKGTYHDNKRQGKGMMIYPKGDRYEGDWEMDLRHGDGDMRFMDGTVYEGQFENDDFNGEGTMRHCSGVVYHGKWINGNPTLLPTKLVIVNTTGKEPVEMIQGQPFDIHVKCVTENGELVEVDSRRELRITAGFKHIKAKKGTALFDLIEEYEEKPMDTPYYQVLQYPLTDFIVEEEEPDQDESEDLKEENEDVLDDTSQRIDFTRSRRPTLISMNSTLSLGSTTEEADDNPALNTTNQSDDMKEEAGKESAMSEAPQTEQPPESALERHPSIPETPMSGLTSVTPASMLDAPLLEKESRPLPPPVANKRSEKGECEWNNIMLPQAPPRFPPFVALDEEERKLRARQNKQVEAKRLNRVAHDERYARIGEYVIMVHDVTNPPFMGQTLEPAFILIKLKKPKREKKAKEVKPKWDTSKHIEQGMTRT